MKRGSRFTTQERTQKRKDAHFLRSTGYSHQAIAKALNVSRGMINEWLNGNQNPRQRGRLFVDREGIAAEARRLRQAGVSFTGIARRIGISATTARKFAGYREPQLT